MFNIATITAAFPAMGILPIPNRRTSPFFGASADVFPPFLLKEMEKIQDPFARKLVSRIEMLPVELSGSKNRIMSTCVKPMVQDTATPLVLLHGFDSSCLEWRYTLPLLEQAGLETWAIDILGWGFSNLGCLLIVFYLRFWKSYIKRPMLLVGPSLGAAVAIDFAIHHPEAVDKLILINASVYAEGTGNLSKLPKSIAYAGIAQLHCLLPWWEDATVDFMSSGGYNVSALIKQRLHCDLQNGIIRLIPNCGHIPHVEKPHAAAALITEFAPREPCYTLPKLCEREDKILVRPF
ncbi:hypothetical protein Ccrd_016193 [Cynara cardunculus var. scolymus]|uniref:AB hydrolase-1 domain-containing protein n=1 Tax=Cynara cardunculus var. scolymus TaxID=59895 RepID=A0A103YAE0_CYNCS|nr:hypothetical protein Ccrd_016193 [Cynara cardunculus var. scolymus]